MDAGPAFRQHNNQDPPRVQHGALLQRLTPMRILQALFFVMVFVYAYLFITSVLNMLVGPAPNLEQDRFASERSEGGRPASASHGDRGVRAVTLLARIDAEIAHVHRKVDDLAVQTRLLNQWTRAASARRAGSFAAASPLVRSCPLGAYHSSEPAAHYASRPPRGERNTSDRAGPFAAQIYPDDPVLPDIAPPSIVQVVTEDLADAFSERYGVSRARALGEIGELVSRVAAQAEQ
jgi:hypothetical protein